MSSLCLSKKNIDCIWICNKINLVSYRLNPYLDIANNQYFNINLKIMAIKKGKFIVGTISNVSFRVYRGKQILQSTPGRGNMRQTKETKSAANIFGKASSLASEFRLSLQATFGTNYDGMMVSRLTGMMRPIIEQCYDKPNLKFNFRRNDFQSLAGFDFNLNSPLQNSMWIMPESSLADNVLTITIPEMKIKRDLKFPSDTNLCSILVSFAIYRLEEGLKSKHPEVKQILVRFKEETLARQQFEFSVPEGCLCIAGIGLSYYLQGEETAFAKNSPTFNPAAICCVYVNEGTYPETHTHLWSENYKAVFK